MASALSLPGMAAKVKRRDCLHGNTMGIPQEYQWYFPTASLACYVLSKPSFRCFASPNDLTRLLTSSSLMARCPILWRQMSRQWAKLKGLHCPGSCWIGLSQGGGYRSWVWKKQLESPPWWCSSKAVILISTILCNIRNMMTWWCREMPCFFPRMQARKSSSYPFRPKWLRTFSL